MNDQRAYQRLGRFLKELGKSETVGNSMMRLLRDSPFLTGPERRFMLDTIAADELVHAAVCAGWARRWVAPTTGLGAFGSLTTRDVTLAAKMGGRAQFAHCLAAVHWNERNVLRYYPGWIRIFERLEPELAKDFREIVKDEETHVAWGRRVIARIERDDPALCKTFEAAYKLTRRVYLAISQATHVPIWHELAEIAVDESHGG